MIKLSIIIPMYNAEKYIADCLDSILKSDLPKGEYEVIIVNDGSKDKGPKIAQDYVSKHENFRYLTQENQGQSVARNYGIKEAQGEYLWFVDSDDKVDSNIAEILNKIEELGKPELFSFFLQYVSEDGHILTKAFYFPGKYNKLTTGRQAIISGYMPSSACVFFIKKSLLDKYKLNFYPGIYSEDSELTYRMMAHAETVYFSDFIPYIYIKHENSSITTNSVKNIIKRSNDSIVVAKSFKNLAEEFQSNDIDLYNVINNHSKNVVFGIVYSLFRNRKMWKKEGVNKAVIAKLKEEGLYPLKGPFHSWKKRLLSFVLNIEALIC